MTGAKYEELYLRALAALRKRAKKTGKMPGEPYWSDTGVRFVQIGDLPYDDERVFREAWGDHSAESILGKRSALRRKCSDNNR